MMRFLLYFTILLTSISLYAQKTPVVFVHGMLAGSDSWMNAKSMFLDAGYSDNELYFFDWNTLNQDRSGSLDLFEDFVKQSMKKAKSKSISLVGHSAGGALCMSLIHERKMAKKIAKYIHVASMPIVKDPLISTLNLYSKDDLITGGKDYNFESVTNSAFKDLDHYEIATDSMAIQSMLQFFGKTEKVTSNNVPPSFKVSVGGRVVTMGENEPEALANLSFYEINAEGKRQTKTPLATIQSDKNGYWSLETLNRNTLIEVIVESQDKNKRKIHYYFESPSENNYLIYFRTLPTSGFAAIMFAGLPKDNQPCLVVYSASKALINERDSLLINDKNIVTQELASAQKTPIAFFVYSSNKEAQDLTAIKSFANFPFLSGVNFNLKENGEHLTIEHGAKTYRLKSLKSEEAIMVKILF
jgi:hypothetical protein